LSDAGEALDKGEVERARELTAPLLARYPTVPVVQDVAADVLYATGDPLSAASLYERAMKKLGGPRVAPKLVAAYAALNRAGDARRVAAFAPDDPMTRLALAWSALAAVGGDRAKGRALAADLAGDTEVRSPAARGARRKRALAGGFVDAKAHEAERARGPEDIEREDRGPLGCIADRRPGLAVDPDADVRALHGRADGDRLAGRPACAHRCADLL